MYYEINLSEFIEKHTLTGTEFVRQHFIMKFHSLCNFYLNIAMCHLKESVNAWIILLKGDKYVMD